MKRLVLLAMLMVVAFYANAYHWTPVSGPYANTATVIGLIQINGEEQSTTTLEVGAFCGNECRGCQTPQHVPQLDCYLIFMTLYGNEGDELGFRLYDSTVGQESELTCATTAIFVANNTYGSVSSPYVLNFEGTTPEYTITVTANPSNGGTVSGSGTYNHGDNCTLTATAGTGYTFVNWTKNGTQVSTSASYSFTVTETASYVANFQVNGYQITASANPSNGGTVSGSGTYNHGDNCTLTATAGTGYTFVNWTKNGTQVSTSASYNFTVTADADFVAHFTQSTFEIIVSASPTEGGTVYGGGAYLYEESCTVIAVANVGYSFNNWTKNGSVVSTDANYTFNVLEDANLVAHFSQDHYNITVSADSEEGGAANGGGSFTYGETCTLTATANIGYTFVNWTKNGTQVSTNASYSFTVTGNASYVAHFTIARYMVTVGAEPAEGGIVHGSGTHNYGSIVTLWAVANEGYVFENWTRDGHVISTNAIHAVRVTEDVEYIAHFRINVFEIKAKTEPENTGDIEGVGFYEYGEICTLTVTPHDGYEFVNWTLEDGEVVSQNPSFSFEVTEERYYIAHLQSVEDVGEQSCNKVDLYPNPAKNKLTIEASEPVNILEVYNINGVLVHKLVNCSERIELNVGTYAIGAYMIRLTMVSTVEIRRFVKE